ncbi:hypothetical protein B0I35DRAFT_180983 [Stachybotrys elegans]|uniref:Cyanovirin-N domain-containing protein n=1 Tax=Stachybotrys elegans TaxID=80388 RepID=A0A8K0S8B0_9HYPO|nr:hypothetical protein B0I35DRAFT_180983 [Stachybotrys elegans]
MSLSLAVRSLSLTGRDVLRVEWKNTYGQTQETHLSLDQRLGNREGSFLIGGVRFSHSARDISLVGDVLHATLSNSRGAL